MSDNIINRFPQRVPCYTKDSSYGGELELSTPDIEAAIRLTNNRAEFFAEMAMKYCDEARQYRDDAQSFAELNTDVTQEDLSELKSDLERTIETRLEDGDYASQSDLPQKLSELQNDTQYVNQQQLENLLPEQAGKTDYFLMTDGVDTSWQKITQGVSCLKSQLTNCLLEVPQCINLTLSDGTLTLKKGSVVTVPYGTTNRTSEFPVGSQFLNSNWKVVSTQFAENKFFVWVELQKDISKQRTEAPDGKDRYISIYLNGTLNGATGSQSGTTFSNALGYNTSENTVYWYDTSGVAQGTQLAFPIGIVACSDTEVFGSIKQVFNGMGYVGRTLWLDKGVKLLVGTGRNADGTIKNTEITTKLFIKASHNYTEDRLLLYKKSGALEDILPQRYLTGLKKDMPANVSETSVHNYFCTDTLETYWTSGSKTASWQQAENKTPIAVYGAIAEADGKTIEYLNSYQAFRAVDYNEFSVLSNKALQDSDKIAITTWGFPSSNYVDLTLGATDSTYTAPANGWYYICKASTGSNQSVSLKNKSNGLWSRLLSTANGNYITAFVPVKKGDIVELTYNAGGETINFRFIYAEGDK